MKVVSGTPTQAVTEQLSVQPLADLGGPQKLRANMWTLAVGDWSWGRHAHSEQEELYLVLDGVARIEAGGEVFELAERDTLVVPAGVAHQIWNGGPEALTFLAAAAPAVAEDSAPA